MTVIDELIRIVRKRQARGERVVWLSPQNRALLGRRITPSRASAPRPAPQPRIAPPMRSAVVMPPPQPAFTQMPPPMATPPMAQAMPLPTNFPPPPDVSAMGWDALLAACKACQCCPLGALRHNIVIEDGCRTAPLMFIGEGPGADEDAQGVPFVGKAGQLLTKMIGAMGRDRTSSDPAHAVYIANIVKCRPPNNRIPAPVEAGACMGYLRRQIALVQPKVIVVLGASALNYLCQKRAITRMRGNWLEYNGIPVMPTFHPAYVLRFEQFPDQFKAIKLQVWSDLKQVMARLVAQ
jgi:uracil-DNA glycosylase